ncbi:MAG: ribosome small subunit-dependent GTPase A [Longimicrobiales bacterium]
MPSGTGQIPGLVRTTVGGAYEVELHPGGVPGAGQPAGAGQPDVVEATLRGRLKQEQRTGDAVVAGDRVWVRRHEDGGYTIEEVEERRTELARRAPGPRGKHQAKVVVANVDQIVAVFSVAHPEPHLRMLDRFLVLAEANGLDAAIVANKVDLDREAAAAFEAYEAIGYPVVYTSAETGEGVDALHELLCGRTSVLTGPSGVGKSSLLNVMEPALQLRVGEVSGAVRKGRHTTVSSVLIPLGCGGYVADTPGLRELGLWGVEAQELGACFPELRPYLGECQFRSCTHTHEPGCAVREAVESGEIRADRYHSYAALLDGDD